MCQDPATLDAALPERVLITIDITDRGGITCWTASRPDGALIEDWRLSGQFMAADSSHTWEVGTEAYLPSAISSAT